jgi:acyl carrier protein
MNLTRYEEIFCTTFEIDKSQLTGMKYQDVDAWDSIGHMGLITALEEAFSIMLETDDIIDMNSFEKGKEILKKYNVVI